MGKEIKFSLCIIFSVFFAIVFAGCDPYKDYASTGLEVKAILLNEDEEGNNQFGYNRVAIITSYEEYSIYSFLDYDESFFKMNDLIVFAVSCCSSDEMEFAEILEYEGKIYPLFSRKKIGKNQAVTDDFIVMSFCAEIDKTKNYQVGEIIYQYK